MIGIAVLAFFLIALNIILWLVFLRKFKALFSTEDIMRSTRVEVNHMIDDVNRATVKNMDLIDFRLKELKAAVADADRHVAMAKGELERQARSLSFQETVKQTVQQVPSHPVQQSASAPVYQKPVSSYYNNISDGLTSSNSYQITKEGSSYLNGNENNSPESVEEASVINSSTGTKFTVYNEGVSVASIPQFGPNVTLSDNPVKPKKDLNQQIKELDQQGYSVEQIAQQLNMTTTEVNFSLDMSL